jgi:hypothetical protein
MPADFGFIVFNDVGRVWNVDEDSKKWHYDYGGGLYFTPYNYVLISATVGFSNEYHVYNFSVGTKFNITF